MIAIEEAFSNLFTGVISRSQIQDWHSRRELGCQSLCFALKLVEFCFVPRRIEGLFGEMLIEDMWRYMIKGGLEEVGFSIPFLEKHSC